MDKKYIVAINPGGISNRLKCLVSLWRIGDLTNRKFLLCWPRNSVCGANFKDLFENNFQEINRENLLNLKRKEFKFHDTNDISIKDSSKKYLLSDTWRWAFLKGEGITRYFPEKDPNYPKYKSNTAPRQNYSGIDFAFHNINPEVKDEILRYLKKIKPIKKIRKEVFEFEKEHDLKKCIGIHMRRGDFLKGKDKLGFISDDEIFLEKMNELLKANSNEKFFLSTDSPLIEKKFEKEFPGKIIKYPKEDFTRTDILVTQEGLIDLILLSKTKHILGTYGSTFTEMAWWLGGGKSKIEIMMNPKRQKEYIEYVRKADKKIIPKIKRSILKLSGRRFI